MSLGSADRQSRARRRVLWGLLKGLAAFALIGIAMAAAYKTGNSVADIDIRRLNEQIARLTKETQAQQTEASGLRAQTAQAQQQVKAWEQRYKTDMPSGDSKALLDLANRKLSEGADVGRLTALINAASNPRVCDEKPETKHLQVKTPIGKLGKEAAVVFGDRKVTVTADGEPALDGKGQKLSWFDPARPITVHFAPLDGQAVDAGGVVPLQHQMIVGDSEFRFSVAVDERKGFATITGERCNFP